MELKEGHIESLRNALKNWTDLTNDERRGYAKYHSQEAIADTLAAQETSLRFLKSDINCVEYEIEVLQRRKDLIWDLICAAEESQQVDLMPVAGVNHPTAEIRPEANMEVCMVVD